MEVNAQDYEGRTPLLLAVRNGHLPATRALLQAGANMEIATKHKVLDSIVHVPSSKGVCKSLEL